MIGQIPLSGKHSADINDQALEKAAAFLEKTATEMEKLSAEWVMSSDMKLRTQGVSMASRIGTEYAAKATLLRGQAGHIREMKLNLK